uniref:ULP_PROTEASE domain-containing protein n=1 Tax=Caenorhabditis tropicalis TaxID=1561998 RepID=A0A1I7TKV5_9PELO
MISVLTYTGLEGCKNTKGVVQPSTVFGKVSNVDLGGFARDHNYKNEPALGSWWSDDSSTLIVQLSMSENVDAEGVQNDEEEERLDQANNFVGDERTDPAPLMIPNEPANAQQNIPDAVRMFMNAQRDFSEVRSAHANNADQEIIKKFFRQTDRYLDSRKSEFRVAKHNETSRTIPYWVAIESAAVAAFEGEDNIHDSSVPSTSQGIRRQRAGLPYNSDESKMKQKRVKEDINSTNLSVADKLRNALAKKKKKMKKNKGISEKRIKNGSCNWPSQGSSRQNLSYSDLLRKMIRRQNSLSNVTDLEDEDGMTMVFVAYDVERGTITPLFFNDVKRKFICHMRDRTLTVTYNTDIIEIYELTKNNEWMSNKKCSTNVSIPVSLHYRPGTMPGMESRLREIETSMFADGDKFSLIESSKNYKRIHMKQYYHPVDPFILVNNLSDWLIAHRQKDPDNVIVHTM